MFTKKSIFVLLVFLSMSVFIHAQSKGTIAFAMRMDTTVVDTVTGEFPDMTWVHALEDSGYVVDTFYTAGLSTEGQETFDRLLNADLVIIGRSVPTTTLGGNSPDDKFAWNDLAVPILTGNMWALRSSRLNWFNTTNITTYTDSVVRNASILDPSDPVFNGLNLNTSEPVPWWDGPMDELGTTDAGSGILIAAGEISGNVYFVRFDPEQEFYIGAIDFPAGYRTFLGNGRDNSSQPPFSYFDFTPESKKVFFAEVANLIKLGGGPSNVKYWGNVTVPSTPVLSQNYPNPFNPTTTISFNLPSRSDVHLSLVDVLGKVVREIAVGSYEAGLHKVELDASGLTAGVYFYKFEAGKFVDVKKLILMK